jgi:cyclic beta-1,2-glucan synthetase
LGVNATGTVIAAPPGWEEPIRAEIFGIERLEKHAESLAAAQHTTDKPCKGRDLLARLDLHSQGVERLRALLPSWRNALPDHRREPEGSLPGGIPAQP